MTASSRRLLLRTAGTAFAGTLAGCVADRTGPDGGTGGGGGSSPGENSTDVGPLTEWERSTDCDRMHDSVFSVQRVRTEPVDAPTIRFADCSDGERDILRTVTGEGGYGTCDPGEAFGRFLDRVREQVERADGGPRVYLERDGTYYGLYVEQGDQVYAY